MEMRWDAFPYPYLGEKEGSEVHVGRSAVPAVVVRCRTVDRTFESTLSSKCTWTELSISN